MKASALQCAYVIMKVRIGDFCGLFKKGELTASFVINTFTKYLESSFCFKIKKIHLIFNKSQRENRGFISFVYGRNLQINTTS